jgi:hypothetical protein
VAGTGRPESIGVILQCLWTHGSTPFLRS